MREHLDALLGWLVEGRSAMLVHVATARGSTPREAGTTMLVGAEDVAGTIGGGEMEHRAIRHARALLASGQAAIVAHALGPDLGQCCGGAVTLAFEPFAPADLPLVEELAREAADPRPLVREVRFEGGGVRRGFARPARAPASAYAVEQTDGVLLVREHVNPSRPALYLFGAGHVGRACVRALHPLGFAIAWIDGRAGQFPDDSPPDVATRALAMPELAATDAPSGVHFLVMTHSHPLDEAICEAVLRRGDFAFLGLIGSRTKRARFARRLAARGIPPGQIARLVCPIGLPGLEAKAPAEIAASVAADFLVRRQEGAQAVATNHRTAARGE